MKKRNVIVQLFLSFKVYIVHTKAKKNLTKFKKCTNILNKGLSKINSKYLTILHKFKQTIIFNALLPSKNI